MCFMAGANAVFTGEKMLTTPCKLLSVCVVRIEFNLNGLGSPWDEVLYFHSHLYALSCMLVSLGQSYDGPLGS